MWTPAISSTRRLLRALACASVPVVLGMSAPPISQDVKSGANAPPSARAEDVRSSTRSWRASIR
jgi:hypothetical protein